LIVVFDQRDEIVCRLHLRDSYTHQHYGMLVCDVVRNIADAFNVHEDDVWQVAIMNAVTIQLISSIRRPLG